MATRFIFASEIQAALAKGDKELELPEGCRLSPQAADLIRERQLRVIYLDPESAKPESDQPQVGPHSILPEPEQALPAAEADEAEEGVLNEEQVEAIAQRVLAKLAEARGEASPAASKPATAPPAPDDDLVICRCEEITKGQIKEAIRAGMSTLNGVKRVTRAGMGLCQGQTCARLVAGILARELGLPPSEIDPTTARAPNRPVTMKALARQ